jgi:hypothetical protein
MVVDDPQYRCPWLRHARVFATFKLVLRLVCFPRHALPHPVAYKARV